MCDDELAWVWSSLKEKLASRQPHVWERAWHVGVWHKARARWCATQKEKVDWLSWLTLHMENLLCHQSNLKTKQEVSIISFWQLPI